MCIFSYADFSVLFNNLDLFGHILLNHVFWIENIHYPVSRSSICRKPYAWLSALPDPFLVSFGLSYCYRSDVTSLVDKHRGGPHFYLLDIETGGQLSPRLMLLVSTWPKSRGRDGTINVHLIISDARNLRRWQVRTLTTFPQVCWGQISIGEAWGGNV